nr:hypothetical protein Iba_chr06cCG12620 [Ipomoea batatas]
MLSKTFAERRREAERLEPPACSASSIAGKQGRRTAAAGVCHRRWKIGRDGDRSCHVLTDCSMLTPTLCFDDAVAVRRRRRVTVTHLLRRCFSEPIAADHGEFESPLQLLVGAHHRRRREDREGTIVDVRESQGRSFLLDYALPSSDPTAVVEVVAHDPVAAQRKKGRRSTATLARRTGKGEVASSPLLAARSSPEKKENEGCSAIVYCRCRVAFCSPEKRRRPGGKTGDLPARCLTFADHEKENGGPTTSVASVGREGTIVDVRESQGRSFLLDYALPSSDPTAVVEVVAHDPVAARRKKGRRSTATLARRTGNGELRFGSRNRSRRSCIDPPWLSSGCSPSHGRLGRSREGRRTPALEQGEDAWCCRR